MPDFPTDGKSILTIIPLAPLVRALRRHANKQMADGLRRGLTSYGDAGFSLFLRKAFIKAMGYSDDALDRPIVGITNTYSDYNPCHGNVPQLIEAVKRGVMLAGALPMEFPTISIHEVFRMADQHVSAQPDGDGHRGDDPRPADGRGRADRRLRQDDAGAADGGGSRRSAGGRRAGRPDAGRPSKGEVLGACTDCRRLWARFRAGEIDEGEIDAVNARLAPTAGTCMVMGTASTMACITEALGMALPMARRYRRRMPSACGSRKRPARSPPRWQAKGPRPSELLTQGRSATRRSCCRRSAARPTG